MEQEIYWIWLSLLPRIHVQQVKELGKKYESLEALWQEKNTKALEKIQGVGDKLAEEILKEEWRKEAIAEWGKCQKEKIQVLGLGEENYPMLLKQIYDPPICLYVQGNVQILQEDSVAMVGAREASEYGKKVAYFLAYQLAQKKLHIVSGLAKGVDSYSHRGVIRAYNGKEVVGKTIAVMGTGCDTIYPKENENLYQQILTSGGAVVTEYRMGTKLNRYHFPERNRINSGLTKRNDCSRSKRKKWFTYHSRICIRPRKGSICGSRKNYRGKCKRK